MGLVIACIRQLAKFRG